MKINGVMKINRHGGVMTSTSFRMCVYCREVSKQLYYDMYDRRKNVNPVPYGPPEMPIGNFCKSLIFYVSNFLKLKFSLFLYIFLVT